MSDFTAKCRKSRPKFSKGGLIRKVANRAYFDDGGPVGGPNAGGVQNSAANPNTGVMGTIAGGVGLNNNFQAGVANLHPGTTPGQLNTAYDQATGALNNQNNLVTTLTPAAAAGVNNQNAVANAEMNTMNGVGPNPAAAELNQATGKNVANQAALMASQRGANSNVGLLARQAAQQGAATQQDAVGQAATLEAEQAITAQQNLGNLANNQISEAGQAITGENSAAQNEQAILENANTSMNNAEVGMQSNVNNVNSQTAAANQNMGANIAGGLMSGVSALSSVFAKGGKVQKKDLDHLTLAEMNAHALAHHRKNFDDGGAVDDVNLGKFSAGDDSASAPTVAASAPLPADSTNFGQIMKPSGGGGGGGGSGLTSLLGMAAMMAEGGEIQPNPLMSKTPMPALQVKIGSGTFNPGSASSGPGIGATSALPANTRSFAKDVQQMGKDLSSSSGQTDEDAEEGYLDADAQLGVGGVDNQEDELPAQQGGAGMGEDEIHAYKGAKICSGPHQSHVANYLAGGGKVPAMVSPDEVYLSPEKARQVVQEGADPMKIGMRIPGKAKVRNDSLKNDTVPMTLEEGGVVIPRHITTHKMAREKAELFVHRALARKKARAS